VTADLATIDAGVETSGMSIALERLITGLADDQIASVLIDEQIMTSKALSDAQRVLSGSVAPTTLLAVLLRGAVISEQIALPAIARRLHAPLWSRGQLHAAYPRLMEGCEALGLSASWCKDQRVAFLHHAAEQLPTAVAADAAPSTARLPWTVILAGSPSPLLVEYLTELSFRYGGAVEGALAAPSDFLSCMEPAADLGTRVGGSLDLQHLRELAEEGPVIELVNSAMSRAVTLRASDLHLEPDSQGFVARVRVDGTMRELERYTSIPYEAVVCRVKILASMDIAERRLPQDGRLDARVNGISFDVRVSVIPMVRGESVVLRLLRQERAPTQLADLGMGESDAQLLQRWLAMPNGLILVTGPTGSGKSTSLYTAIDLLGKKTDKIVTVEDPVEYKLPGISQIQVNADIGLDFPQALRSILRHDPDVILIGEIRDGITAQIATQAALTGHLVLSTLHTNTAAGAVTRLLDMGVDSYLLADSLKGVMAQRLVRRLCPDCKQAADECPAPLRERLDRLHINLAAARPMRPVGCEKCSQSGYFGRVGIYDLIAFDSSMSQLIRPGVTAHDLETSAHHLKQSVPWADGWRKAAAGETTVEEIVGNTSELLQSPEVSTNLSIAMLPKLLPKLESPMKPENR